MEKSVPKQTFVDEMCAFYYYVMWKPEWKPVACQSVHFFDIFKEFQNVDYIFSLVPSISRTESNEKTVEQTNRNVIK